MREGDTVLSPEPRGFWMQSAHHTWRGWVYKDTAVVCTSTYKPVWKEKKQFNCEQRVKAVHSQEVVPFGDLQDQGGDLIKNDFCLAWFTLSI